jgi:hypothetical protein
MNFFKDLPRLLRAWIPPLIVIPAMLLVGFWSDVAYYFLFTHHLFWMIGGILLIIPAIETLWPLQPTAKAQPRTKQKPASATETPAERLVRLQQQKKVVDRKIEKLSVQNKEHKR